MMILLILINTCLGIIFSGDFTEVDSLYITSNGNTHLYISENIVNELNFYEIEETSDSTLSLEDEFGTHNSFYIDPNYPVQHTDRDWQLVNASEEPIEEDSSEVPWWKLALAFAVGFVLFIGFVLLLSI